jgi:hypothetical protein
MADFSVILSISAYLIKQEMSSLLAIADLLLARFVSLFTAFIIEDSSKSSLSFSTIPSMVSGVSFSTLDLNGT